MGIIKTAMLTGGGLYAVNKIASAELRHDSPYQGPRDNYHKQLDASQRSYEVPRAQPSQDHYQDPQRPPQYQERDFHDKKFAEYSPGQLQSWIQTPSSQAYAPPQPPPPPPPLPQHLHQNNNSVTPILASRQPAIADATATRDPIYYASAQFMPTRQQQPPDFVSPVPENWEYYQPERTQQTQQQQQQCQAFVPRTWSADFSSPMPVPRPGLGLGRGRSLEQGLDYAMQGRLRNNNDQKNYSDGDGILGLGLGRGRRRRRERRRGRGLLSKLFFS